MFVHEFDNLSLRTRVATKLVVSIFDTMEKMEVQMKGTERDIKA